MPVEIPLSHGLVALVDEQDAPMLRAHQWGVSSLRSKYVYAIRVGRGGGMPMHRLILDARRGQFVDHVDGNGLNNTRANLRLCSHAQNQGNRSLNKNNTSGFKGVFLARSGSFTASIAGSRLGMFPAADDAARAYDAAARERWGAFASLNFPQPGERSALTGDVCR